MKRRTLIPLFAVIVVVVGCAQVSQIATQVAVQEGHIDQQQADSINRTVEATLKAWSDVTPEQEHYIGRAVAATLLATYPPVDDQLANRYLNVMGQTLALFSDRPETFGGYRFLLVDSDDINAFACPGGLILVTRGLVSLCENEDALAAVLAHEIGHVAGKHGLRAIKKSRWTNVGTLLATEGARNFGSEELAQLTEELEGSIHDITQTLINNGYSKDLEREADEAAVAVLTSIGYNPRGLEAMLLEMEARWQPSGPGFMRTHPSPMDRLADVTPAIQTVEPLGDPPGPRQLRFETALAGILK